MAEASLSAEQVEALPLLAFYRCVAVHPERHDQGGPGVCEPCRTVVAAMLSAAEDAARAEGVQRGRAEVAAAVEAVLTRSGSVELPRVSDEGRVYEFWRGYRHARGEMVQVVRSALADSTAPDAHAAGGAK